MLLRLLDDFLVKHLKRSIVHTTEVKLGWSNLRNAFNLVHNRFKTVEVRSVSFVPLECVLYRLHVRWMRTVTRINLKYRTRSYLDMSVVSQVCVLNNGHSEHLELKRVGSVFHHLVNNLRNSLHVLRVFQVR